MEIRTTSEIKVRLVDSMGDDAGLAAAAKVLEPEAYEEFRRTHVKHDTAGLLSYLMGHRHGTPFEHACLKFFVHAPIFVWREWHRHRIAWSYNEESGRYKVLEPVFYLPNPDRPMMKVDGWKPGRPKFLQCDDSTVYRALCQNLRESYCQAYEAYQRNLALGIDPGLARDCLPVGIYSACYVTCNPRSMMAFLSLRTHEPDALKVSYPLYEIEVAARKCEAIFAERFPLTYAAFNKHKRLGP